MGARLLRSAFCPVIRRALPLTASCLVTPSAYAEDAASPCRDLCENRDGETHRYGGTQLEIRTRRWLRCQAAARGIGGSYLIKGALLRQAQGVSFTPNLSYSF